MNTIRMHLGEDDKIGLVDNPSPHVHIPKYNYTVLVPLFKRGKEYLPGDTIELDENTARGFIELNEIKEETHE